MGARTGGAYVTFTPAKQRSWKYLAQAYMASAMAGRGGPLEGPLSVEIVATWPRPKSVKKSLGTGPLWRPSRPDADNVAKQLLDSANGVLFLDDAQVVRLVVEKRVAAEGAGACVAVVVEPAVSRQCGAS